MSAFFPANARRSLEARVYTELQRHFSSFLMGILRAFILSLYLELTQGWI
jgi:hypothetical protein